MRLGNDHRVSTSWFPSSCLLKCNALSIGRGSRWQICKAPPEWVDISSEMDSSVTSFYVGRSLVEFSVVIIKKVVQSLDRRHICASWVLCRWIPTVQSTVVSRHTAQKSPTANHRGIESSEDGFDSIHSTLTANPDEMDCIPCYHR